MRKICWIILAVVTTKYCPAQKYSGPERIGPFHIDRNTPARVLFRELGAPTRNLELYCYRTPDKKAFMYFETIDNERENVGAVFLSDFPNCVHMPIQEADDFQAWKTAEGIGLGSSEADVLKAYGRPSSKDKVALIDPRRISGHIVRGYRAGETLPHAGDYSLFYNGDITTDLRAAEFGIRNGKVSWIWLNQNE